MSDSPAAVNGDVSEETGLTVTGDKTLFEFGSAEIAPVDPKEYESFVEGVDACALEVDETANKQKAANIEQERKDRENEIKRYQRKQAIRAKRRAFTAKVSKVTSPFTTPIVKRLDVVMDYVGAKYDAYADAQEKKEQKEAMDRLILLYNAVQPIVFRAKGLSAVEEKSNFSLYKQFDNGSEHKAIHFVAVKNERYESKIENIVVMSVLDTGHIRILGNCEAFLAKMGKEATFWRSDANSSSGTMNMMWWDAREKQLGTAFESSRWNKEKSREYYKGFNKKAINSKGAVNEAVVREAKDKFVRMLLNQDLYAPTNQKLQTLDL